MKKRISNKTLALLAVSTLSLGFAATAKVVSATTAHPAPYPIIDEWRYGVSDNYGYSNLLCSVPK